jgi:FkbM family methyltransferase
VLEVLRRNLRRSRVRLNIAAGRFPNLKVDGLGLPLIHLGTSSYGGWTFVDAENLRGATIVSCGLGEDASFDVEFVKRFGAKVVLIDPTPRAAAHFVELNSRMGMSAESAYTDTGAEDARSYDLSRLTSDQFDLKKVAIWNSCGPIRFFAPKDERHVSYSITNFQNNYKTDTTFTEVEAITYSMILEESKISSLPLIKLDIEGAEIEVVLDILDSEVLPGQILVEYDELSLPSARSKQRALLAHHALLARGYHLVFWDGSCNFTYWRSTEAALPVTQIAPAGLR